MRGSLSRRISWDKFSDARREVRRAGQNFPHVLEVTGSEATTRGAEPLWGGATATTGSSEAESTRGSR